TDLHPAEADASRWFADGGRKPERLLRRPDGRPRLAVEGDRATAARESQLRAVRLGGRRQRELDGTELDGLIGLQPQRAPEPVTLDDRAVAGTEVGQDDLTRRAQLEPGVGRRHRLRAGVDVDVA